MAARQGAQHVHIHVVKTPLSDMMMVAALHLGMQTCHRNISVS